LTQKCRPQHVTGRGCRTGAATATSASQPCRPARDLSL
jgi:hypothetical protein